MIPCFCLMDSINLSLKCRFHLKTQSATEPGPLTSWQIFSGIILRFERFTANTDRFIVFYGRFQGEYKISINFLRIYIQTGK